MINGHFDTLMMFFGVLFSHVTSVKLITYIHSSNTVFGAEAKSFSTAPVELKYHGAAPAARSCTEVLALVDGDYCSFAQEMVGLHPPPLNGKTFFCVF